MVRLRYRVFVCMFACVFYECMRVRSLCCCMFASAVVSSVFNTLSVHILSHMVYDL